MEPYKPTLASLDALLNHACYTVVHPARLQATTALGEKLYDGLYRDRDVVDLLPKLLRVWEPGRFSHRCEG